MSDKTTDSRVFRSEAFTKALEIIKREQAVFRTMVCSWQPPKEKNDAAG